MVTAQILACGSRTHDDYEYIRRRLSEVAQTYFFDEPIVMVHGAAKGADQFAGIAGRSLGWDVYEVPAQWDKHGKAAGPIRNAEMLRLFDPYVVCAFPKGPLAASRGTLDMVSRAAAEGVMVIVF
jgi:hypothetical protein